MPINRAEKGFFRRARYDAQMRIDANDSSERVISGYAAVFNSETEICPGITESIASGAFADSISRGDDVRALFNHDPSLILGRTKAETLFLTEDDKGLFSKILLPDTQLGRDLATSIARGDISQMSFGFWIESESREIKADKTVHYVITKAKLFDVSPVTFPAYEETEVSLERSFSVEINKRRLNQLQESAKAELELRDRQIMLLKNGY